MKTENSPQEITADEKGLGFERLALEPGGLEWGRGTLHGPFVVFRLNSSDVIHKATDAKGNVVYIHKRFGKHKDDLKGLPPDWEPMATELDDPKLAIINAKDGITKAAYASDIIPQTFKYQTA